ncbi:MAG: RNA methyltransferase [Smithellaceae bacterium]|nr:RNA methyltransferase [Smithellaceae bacterium]
MTSTPLQTRRENIAIVLCRPKYGGNIGSVARVAMNMGIERIIVAEPAGVNMAEAKKLATHFASPLVDQIEYFPALKEALAGFQWIVGTTSKLGKGRRPVVHPRQAAEEIVSISQHNQVALLFGAEDDGLTNEDLRYCHSFVTIPADRKFSSLNLSHAVMVICYELFIARIADETPFVPRLASSVELEGMYENLRDFLIEADFLKHKDPDQQMLYLRRFLSRTRLTSQDVQVIRGICRQIQWYTNNKSA